MQQDRNQSQSQSQSQGNMSGPKCLCTFTAQQWQVLQHYLHTENTVMHTSTSRGKSLSQGSLASHLLGHVGVALILVPPVEPRAVACRVGVELCLVLGVASVSIDGRHYRVAVLLQLREPLQSIHSTRQKTNQKKKVKKGETTVQCMDRLVQCCRLEYPTVDSRPVYKLGLFYLREAHIPLWACSGEWGPTVQAA